MSLDAMVAPNDYTKLQKNLLNFFKKNWIYLINGIQLLYLRETISVWIAKTKIVHLYLF